MWIRIYIINYDNLFIQRYFLLSSLEYVVICFVSGDFFFTFLQLKETNVTKLCVTREILTVNGQYPGPEIRVRKGDTVFVNTYNQGFYGVTLHW